MPATIDGQEIQHVTIDGQQVEEITMDGDVVWKGVEIIDNFEDGSAANWHVPSSTGSDQVISPGLAGTDFRWQLNGFREASLDGGDAVDRGPAQGDRFEYQFRIDNYTGSPSLIRFQWASSSEDDPDQYFNEYELNGTDPDVATYKELNGNTAKTSTFKAINVTEGDIVRCVVRWNYGDNRIESDHYVNGDFKHTISITDTQFTNPGISLFVNGFTVASFDEIKITDTI